MARIGQFWTGLLTAGALALVLALFTLSNASAHGVPHRAPAPILSAHAHHHELTVMGGGSPAQVQTVDQADCHKGHVLTAAKPAKRDHAPGCRCHDGCACGCASACLTHAVTGLPVGTAILPGAMATIRLPMGRSDDLAGRTSPPEPRPPLSI